MDVNTQIHPFDIDNIEDCSSIAIIGRRRGGKTHLCKYLISHVFAKKYGRFIVLAGTRDCKVSYGDIIPKNFIHEFSIAQLKTVRDYQNELVSRYESQCLPKEGRVCVILDDIGADRAIMNSEIIRDLYANSRHYGIMLVSLHQYPYQIAPANRANLDYVFLCSFGAKKLTSLYFQEFVNVGSEEQFSFAFKSSTSNMGLTCVIDNTTNPQSMSECVFHLRQEPHLPLRRVFDPIQWQWCESMYDKQEEVFTESDEDIDDLSDTLFQYRNNRGRNFQVVLTQKQKMD